MSPAQDAAIGALVLVGDHNFKKAHWFTLAAAWLFGRHQTFTHLDCRGRVAFWRGQPYLLTFREAR